MNKDTTSGTYRRANARLLFTEGNEAGRQIGFTGREGGHRAAGQGVFNHEWTLIASSHDYALELIWD